MMGIGYPLLDHCTLQYEGSECIREKIYKVMLEEKKYKKRGKIIRNKTNERGKNVITRDRMLFLRINFELKDSK